MPPHALSAADFPTVRAEAFDEHVVPTDTKLETRPKAPTVYLQWVRQAENMAHAFALVYGREYREPIFRFLRHLQHLHEGNDHQYPFSFIADAWEEVFWRETEEIRHAVAPLLKTTGKEASRKEDFVAAALVARSDGAGPALRLPTVRDYEDTQGYFSSVILQRLRERAMRVRSGGTTPTRRAWRARHASRARKHLPPRLRPQHPARRVMALTPLPQRPRSRAIQVARF